MNQLRGSRLVALVAAAGAAVVLAAAPSPAAGPDPSTAPLPDLSSVTDLVKEKRPGTASVPKERPTSPGPDRPARGWHGPQSPAPTTPPAPPRAPAPAPPTPPPPSSQPPPSPAPVQPTPTPTPTPPAPTQPPVQGPRVPDGARGPSELMARVIELTNRDRALHGCAALTPQAALSAAAQGHADDMSQQVYFSHTGLDGRTFDQRMKDAGYPGSQFGENIASGFPTADEVQAAWMATPGHRRNILDCSFKEIGVGYADDGEFWVVNFGA